MLKFIFRLIGIIVVVVILIMAVLCYLDSKDLLSGKLGRLIGVLRILGKEAWDELRLFVSSSGIGEDAADLLDQGAAFFRESVEPHPTDKPGSHPYTPEPTATPNP